MSDYQNQLCEERHKSLNNSLKDNKNRLDKHETEIKDVKEAIIVLTQLQTRHDDEIRDHENRIRTIESKPAKRWDGAVQQIITILLAGSMGGVVVRLFGV